MWQKLIGTENLKYLLSHYTVWLSLWLTEKWVCGGKAKAGVEQWNVGASKRVSQVDIHKHTYSGQLSRAEAWVAEWDVSARRASMNNPDAHRKRCSVYMELGSLTEA